MRAIPDSHSISGEFAGFEQAPGAAFGTLLIAADGATLRFPIASISLIAEIARLAYLESIRLVFVSDGFNRRLMRPSYIERGAICAENLTITPAHAATLPAKKRAPEGPLKGQSRSA